MRKNKTISLYKLLNSGSGDEVFLDFRPNKKEIAELADKEFGHNEEQVREHFQQKDYIIEKLEVYSL